MLGVAGHRSAGGDPLLLCSRGEARPQDGGRPWRGRHGRVLLPGEVLQTCKLPCTPTSQAPDTGDAVYKLTYTADMDGFQAMGDHLPVSVIFSTPRLVSKYLSRSSWILCPRSSCRRWLTTPRRLVLSFLCAFLSANLQVAAARADFLKVQEEVGFIGMYDHQVTMMTA